MFYTWEIVIDLYGKVCCNTYMLKKFESVNTKQEIRITLTSNYALGFPNKFYTENTISSYKYVVLFYDEESKEIGIHFSNDDDEKHKFKIRHDKKTKLDQRYTRRSFNRR